MCIVSKEPHRVVSVEANGFVDGLSDGYGVLATLPVALSAIRRTAVL